MNNPPHIQRWAGLLAELRFAATAAAGGLLSALVWWLFMVSLFGLWLGGAWLVGVI